MIEITKDTVIGDENIVFRYSRSAGPGGQNVNKVNTRVTALFDVANCTALTEKQKRRILRNLATRATKQRVIRVVSQRHRTQKANRNAALERLTELLRAALKTRPVRKKTKVPAWARQKRLDQKKRRSLLKKQRTDEVDYSN